jgi:hypothetical protein
MLLAFYLDQHFIEIKAITKTPMASLSPPGV